jgi:hypothetical protein
VALRISGIEVGDDLRRDDGVAERVDGDELAGRKLRGSPLGSRLDLRDERLGGSGLRLDHEGERAGRALSEVVLEDLLRLRSRSGEA